MSKVDEGFYIISPKLKKTLSPFQKVYIQERVQTAEEGIWLVRVLDIRGEEIWFGQVELELAEKAYLQHKLMELGKMARIGGLPVREWWDPLTLQGYLIQAEKEEIEKKAIADVAAK